MNHGSCIRCWWHYKGRCYMHNGGNDGVVDYVEVKEDSYCPDYINRMKEDISIEQWLKERI